MAPVKGKGRTIGSSAEGSKRKITDAFEVPGIDRTVKGSQHKIGDAFWSCLVCTL